MTSLTSHILKELFQHSQRFGVQLSRQGIRNLYSPASLGIDGFEKTQNRIKQQFIELEDRFKTKMGEFVAPNSTSLIFTEDLKNMIHLVESDQDINLLEEMMKKFNQQNKEIRFGNFVFGPVVMRMYHKMNKHEEAYKVFKSPEFKGFFDQLMSFQILGDLLLINNKYDEILDLFETVKSKQMENATYPRNVVVLLFAALYKKNTPESLAKAEEIYNELIKFGHFPLRRAITFFGALALNQNKPSLALELSSGKQANYITMRSIRIEALAQISRPDDILPILKTILQIGDPSRPIRTIPKQTYDKIVEAVEKFNNPDLTREFEMLSKQLKEHNHIEDNSLDHYLMKDIEPLIRDDNWGNRGERWEGNRGERWEGNRGERWGGNRGERSEGNRDDRFGGGRDRFDRRTGDRFDRRTGDRFERNDNYGDRDSFRKPFPSIRDMS